MKKNIFLLPLFFGWLVLFNSCEKEFSCENCLTGNQPPIAVAGPDQVIILPKDSVLLDGSSSSDPDGTISTWLWTKITGPASFAIANSAASVTMINNLTAGTYQFLLKVTDDKGASAVDTVNITVSVLQNKNHPPVANAGYDTTIILPANICNLDGSLSSDPDNNIAGYVWSKIAGPSSFNLVNANGVQTQVNNLVEGVYLFELKVTDATGLFDRDTVQVTIVQNNKAPSCTDCKIVFVSDRDGNAEIYSCKTDGSNITRLTHDAGSDEQPAWSPDGSQIAFISNRTGQTELYIMNADGSNVVRKTFSETIVENPAWAPDGKRITYSSNADIWIIGAQPASGSLLPLFEAQGWEGQPAWSPDGTKIALASDMQAYDFVYDIFIMNSDGTNIAALTGNIFDQFDYLQPRWSPDGTTLALAISHTIGIDQYETSIGVMNPNGTGLTAIISGAAPWSSTSWSPDGKNILYTSLSGTRKDIAWVSSNGSASGTIVTNGWNADWQH